MSSYSELYLDTAMDCLGEAFDVAINDFKLDPDTFYDMFDGCGFAERFGQGDPNLICGISGRDLAYRVVTASGLFFFQESCSMKYDKTPEYWAGWILAYFQFQTNMSFKSIHHFVSMKEIIEMYYPLHEASEEQCLDIIKEKIISKGTTAVQRYRKREGLSQSQLAKQCGINLRTIQQYEIGNRSITNASYQTVITLSKALHCEPNEISIDF